MNGGLSRLLSRRDKFGNKRSSKNNKSSPGDYYDIFSKELPRSLDKEDEKKIKTLVQRLHDAGITSLHEPQAYYALSFHPNDIEKAYDVLLLANDAFEGVITEYDPNVTMLGAVNRSAVTCYLDALLFAMFARLDSFEAMLFDNFNDEPRKKLAAILRLWVNLLRSGRLIDIDLTKRLQEALAKCGWREAAEVRQQDASEAFSFITGKLELPLLTLKMDIYHTGREDKEDDHKFVNERLLDVAIPEQQDDKVITLEHCLEAYFNNRIEVKRYLQRQNTLGSSRSSNKDPDKGHIFHIETTELSGSSSPIVSTPTSIHPTGSASVSSPARPVDGRRRADSIFSERYRTDTIRPGGDKKPFDEKQHLCDLWDASSGGRPRAASLRKEVLMPAWQFYSLIPWYTDNVPKTDAQVAAHFSSQRPVLGICLKRYSILPDGKPNRLNTYIDIPLEIGLPAFVSDDRVDDSGPLFGNFKLVLQSCVCHRGMRVDEGHYVSLVRANRTPPSHNARPRSATSQQQQQQQQQSDEVEQPDEWFLFDDLAPKRVRQADVKLALKEESPYLLFYQVQPIDEDLASRGDPPKYEDIDMETSGTQSRHGDASETQQSADTTLGTEKSEIDLTSGISGPWEKVERVEGTHTGAPSVSVSLAASDCGAAARSSMSSIGDPLDAEPGRKSSVTIELDPPIFGSESAESLTAGAGGTHTTADVTPAEEKSGWLSARGRRSSKANSSGTTTGKSRPPSQSGEGRLSLTLSRFKGIGSKDKLGVMDATTGNHNTTATTNDEDATTETEHAVGIGRTKSKGKGKEKEKDKDGHKEKKAGRLRSKSKDPGPLDGNGNVNGRRQRGRPDRECMVM